MAVKEKDRNIESSKSDGREKVFLVKVVHSSEIEVCLCPQDIGIKKNSHVILPTKYGKDLGLVLGEIKNHNNYAKEETETIIRVATESDLDLFEKNREKEGDAFNICRKMVKKNNLEMKLVSSHYLMDEPKILFFFTAESRVDFRDLVKDLVSVFKMRIELRQIGVRDESRVLGGIGVCGRLFCCHGVTDKLRPVSIKMAKEQSISLNSMKISGSCGRLLCCLSYEFDCYHSIKKGLPGQGDQVLFNGETRKVKGVNLLSKIVKIVDGDGIFTDIPFCRFIFDSKKGKWKIKS